MGGGLKTKAALVAVMGVAGLASGGAANAADLGGDCCADLEERIAELEATTARKGNRKVSLEIYGQVNQGVIWWDDGFESNAYVVTNDNSRTRVGFRGKAKVSDDWEAGYRIEIGIRTANSKRFTQNNPEGNDNPVDIGLDVRDAFWFVKSKSLGQGSVGMQASATDQITEINLTQTQYFSKYSDQEDSGLGLFLRNPVTGGYSAVTWRRLIGEGGDQPGEGERRFNLVKYESPTWRDFTLSASWGQDDFGDIALRYASEWGDFRVAAGIGYFQVTDVAQTKTICNDNALPADRSDMACNAFGGSFSVIHDPTGLYVNFGAGTKTDEIIEDARRFAGTGVDDGQDFWSAQAGIEKKFCEYGKTTIYGEYYDYDGGASSRVVRASDALNPFGVDAAIWGTGVQSFGGGIAQGFDAAALILYLQYRHYEGDLTLRQINSGVASGPIANAPFTDLDIVFSGGIIRF